MDKKQKLLDRSECLALLCSKANTHWSFIRFLFQIPIIIIATVMCVMNSFNNSGESMRIANVCVNGCNIMILSFFNQLRVAEKCELFKNESNYFMQLSHQIEAYEDIDNETLQSLVDKYDNLVSQVLFEDIPISIKKETVHLFKGRFIPIQLNGCSGINTNPSTPTALVGNLDV